MSSDNAPTTIFSIYKIDLEKIVEVFNLRKEIFAKDAVDSILNSTMRLISGKNDTFVSMQRVEHNGFQGIVYRTKHKPEWEVMVNQIIQANEYASTDVNFDSDLININVSYILLYHYEEEIFAMTGGYGSSYIRGLAESNFGLYLLPKLIEKDNPVVKNVIESRVSGNLLAAHRTNRSATSITVEQDLTNIYRELNVELNRSMVSALGLEFDEEESKDKKINLINKDSLVIRRSLSLPELVKVIKNICKLSARKNNFSLGYLVEARKKDIKNSDLLEMVTSLFTEQKYDNDRSTLYRTTC